MQYRHIANCSPLLLNQYYILANFLLSFKSGKNMRAENQKMRGLKCDIWRHRMAYWKTATNLIS